MNNKYLTNEGIEHKYNLRGKIIDFACTTGIAGGIAQCLYVCSQNKKPSEYLIGVGIIGVSLIAESYLSKRNDNKKQKALEKRL